MKRPTFEDFATGRERICVLGLGCVGLPLAAALAKKFRVIGFDINAQRVGELRRGIDRTRELAAEQLKAVSRRTVGRDKVYPPLAAPEAIRARKAQKGRSSVVRRNDAHQSPRAGLEFTTDPEVLSEARLIIVTVPTPVDGHKRPDLRPLVGASTGLFRHPVRPPDFVPSGGRIAKRERMMGSISERRVAGGRFQICQCPESPLLQVEQGSSGRTWWSWRDSPAGGRRAACPPAERRSVGPICFFSREVMLDGTGVNDRFEP